MRDSQIGGYLLGGTETSPAFVGGRPFRMGWRCPEREGQSWRVESKRQATSDGGSSGSKRRASLSCVLLHVLLPFFFLGLWVGHLASFVPRRSHFSWGTSRANGISGISGSEVAAGINHRRITETIMFTKLRRGGQQPRLGILRAPLSSLCSHWLGFAAGHVSNGRGSGGVQF